MKKCWRCAEEIQDAALACRYCGAGQDTASRMAQAAGQLKPEKSKRNTGGCLVFGIGSILAIWAIGKYGNQIDMSASENSSASIASTVSPDEAKAKFAECAKVVKSQKGVGMIESINIEDNRLDRVFVTVVVNERKWKRAPYNVKMSVMMAPLCEHLRGYPMGKAMTLAVSNLTRESLGGGAPGEGTLTVN